jgi:hypothetical protein
LHAAEEAIKSVEFRGACFCDLRSGDCIFYGSTCLQIAVLRVREKSELVREWTEKVADQASDVDRQEKELGKAGVDHNEIDTIVILLYTVVQALIEMIVENVTLKCSLCAQN